MRITMPLTSSITWYPATFVETPSGDIQPTFSTGKSMPGFISGNVIYGEPLASWKPRQPVPGDRVAIPGAVRPLEYRIESIVGYQTHCEITVADLAVTSGG